MKKIKKVTGIGILSNILLAVFKFTVGVTGKSQAVIASEVLFEKPERR